MQFARVPNYSAPGSLQSDSCGCHERPSVQMSKYNLIIFRSLGFLVRKDYFSFWSQDYYDCVKDFVFAHF